MLGLQFLTRARIAAQPALDADARKIKREEQVQPLVNAIQDVEKIGPDKDKNYAFGHFMSHNKDSTTDVTVWTYKYLPGGDYLKWEMSFNVDDTGKVKTDFLHEFPAKDRSRIQDFEKMDTTRSRGPKFSDVNSAIGEFAKWVGQRIPHRLDELQKTSVGVKIPAPDNLVL